MSPGLKSKESDSNDGTQALSADSDVGVPNVNPMALPANIAKKPRQALTVMEKQTADLIAEANMLRNRNKLSDAVITYDRLLKLDPRNSEALNSKGVCLKQLGDVTAAMNSYQAALQANEKDWCAHNNIGVLFKENGLFQEAINSYLRAIENGPADCVARENMATVLTDLGTRLKMAGSVEAAVLRYNEATTYTPKYAPAYFNLGVVYSEMGRYEEALHYYGLSIEHNPNYVESICNIGVIFKNTGKLETAISYYEKALKVNPNFQIASSNIAIAYTDLGTKVKNAGDVEAGIKYYKKALVHNTKYPDAWYNLGVAYSELHDTSEAIICYEVAVGLNPKCSEAYNNLGVIYKDQGNLEKSILYYQAALVANPLFAQTLNNIGVIYTMLGKLDEAYLYCNKAIQANPSYASAYNNLGVLYRDEGRIYEAIDNYERCLKFDPQAKNAGQNRLIALNYLVDKPVAEVSNEHKLWGEGFDKQYEKLGLNIAEHDPNRVLRIGYLSPDFFVHSVSYFIEAALAHHDVKNTFVVCYSNVVCEDAKTERLKTMPDLWRSVCGLGSEKAARMIRDDKIDILVDLAGHTAGNRLDVMAHRPAPIQVTWIGYPNTTGLPSVDYRITDHISDPVDQKQEYVEELVRLPSCFLCYTPSQDPPEVAPLPASTNGFVTFGSFNNLAKLNPEVFRLWGQVLSAVPNSRFLMKCKPFASESVKKKIFDTFESIGVPSKRIDLLPLVSGTSDHLKIYNLVDISLDTFPYAGTTTTCESLFMGVPCITLKGNCHAFNVGVSLLTHIANMKPLIADTMEEYVEKSISLANDLPRLSHIRQNLRQWMLSSALCDGPTFVKDLDLAYRSMWHKYIADHK